MEDKNRLLLFMIGVLEKDAGIAVCGSKFNTEFKQGKNEDITMIMNNNKTHNSGCTGAL